MVLIEFPYFTKVLNQFYKTFLFVGIFETDGEEMEEERKLNIEGERAFDNEENDGQFCLSISLKKHVHDTWWLWFNRINFV